MPALAPMCQPRLHHRACTCSTILFSVSCKFYTHFAPFLAQSRWIIPSNTLRKANVSPLYYYSRCRVDSNLTNTAQQNTSYHRISPISHQNCGNYQHRLPHLVDHSLEPKSTVHPLHSHHSIPRRILPCDRSSTSPE